MSAPAPTDPVATLKYVEQSLALKPPRLLAKKLNIRHAMTIAPPPMDEILRGLTPGMVGVILGTGGIGKSMLVLYIAYAVGCVATGLDPLGCLLPPGIHEPGRIVYLAGEDGEDALWRRLFAFAGSFPEAERAAIVERMHEVVDIAPLVGEAPTLLDHNNLLVESALEDVREAVRGSRAAVIDPLRQFHAGDENDNGAMTLLSKALSKIAVEEKCAIILVHHFSKTGVREGDDGVTASRGAIAISDNARWSMTLRGLGIKEFQKVGLIGERWQYLVVRNPKVNYVGNGSPTILKRIGGGLLAPVTQADYEGEGDAIATALRSVGIAADAEQSAEGGFEDEDIFG
jgi:hypothetical protein